MKVMSTWIFVILTGYYHISSRRGKIPMEVRGKKTGHWRRRERDETQPNDDVISPGRWARSHTHNIRHSQTWMAFIAPRTRWLICWNGLWRQHGWYKENKCPTKENVCWMPMNLTRSFLSLFMRSARQYLIPTDFLGGSILSRLTLLGGSILSRLTLLGRRATMLSVRSSSHHGPWSHPKQWTGEFMGWTGIFYPSLHISFGGCLCSSGWCLSLLTQFGEIFLASQSFFLSFCKQSITKLTNTIRTWFRY
jgi:hypothetical protein